MAAVVEKPRPVRTISKIGKGMPVVVFDVAAADLSPRLSKDKCFEFLKHLLQEIAGCRWVENGFRPAV